MDALRIACDNHAFFYAAVGPALCDEMFAEAVLRSFDEPAQYGIEEHSHSGYILVDGSDVKRNCSHGSFAELVRDGLLGRVALKVPNAIAGELNATAAVVYDIWKFSFEITEYERDRAHDFEVVADPAIIPDGERVGRRVKLKITLK